MRLRNEGKRERNREIARTMTEQNYPLAAIANVLSLSENVLSLSEVEVQTLLSEETE